MDILTLKVCEDKVAGQELFRQSGGMMLNFWTMVGFPQQKYSVRSIVATFLGLVGFAISGSIFPPLLTTIADDLGVSYTRFGLVIMLQFFSFFLAGLIGGWMNEHLRVSCRAIILTGLLLVAISVWIGSQLNSINGFLLIAIPLGAGGGMIEIFCAVIISQREKPHSSNLMNLSQVFFCLGAIIGPLIVSAFLYHYISWRTIFVVFGFFIFFLFFVFFILTRDLIEAASDHSSKETNPSGSLLKDPLFILLASSLFVYVTFETIVACWVSVYFEIGLSCSVESAAMLLSLFWFGLIVGRSTTVLLSSRVSLWPVMFIGIFICVVTAFFATLTHNPYLAALFVFFNGFGAGPLWPNIVAICQSARNRPRFTSAVIAIGALGVTAGSGLGSAIFKYVGASWFFPTVGVGVLVLLVLTILSCRKYSRDQ